MEIHIAIAPETLFTVGPVNVTNSMFMMFVVMGLLLIVGTALARKAKLVPGRWQGLFEVSATFILDLVESTGGRSFGRRIFPLIGGVFIFLLIANYTGILPGVGTIGIYHTEEAGAEADEADQGAGTAVESTAVELISEFGRIISLSARLFGNVLAGEVLLAVMYAAANLAKFAIVPLLVPVVFIILELLFGTIQALVFALLTAIYITMAAGDSHGGEHHEAHPDESHGPEPATSARVPAAAGD
jgi:F-type H+-transporting ATPase subunit a